MNRHSLAIGGAALLVVVVLAAVWATRAESPGPPPVASLPTWREVELGPDSYHLNPDNPRAIVLNLILGVGDTISGTTVTETATSVTVRVRVREELRVKAALGIPTTVVITLDEPLGTRAVVDANGRRVSERR